MPGYQEIMDLLGFKSKNAVYKLINKLIDDGIVGKDSKGKLIPNKLFGEIPLLGVVEAGFPSPAEEDLADTINFDDFLIENRGATYILTVKGDSMIDAGIHEGDMVIAERGSEPRDGDIVIAELDGGWTMKYLRKKGNQTYLEPANKRLKNMYPKEGLHVAAIVKAVVRKY
ncbi:LexA family transcriptional regulator [bacterium]|nr:LexA family transcriptional regulator [bacterium]